MKRSGRLSGCVLSLAAFIVSCVVFLVPSGAAFAADLLTTDNESSCIASWSGASGGFTWSNGMTKTLRAKCYYDLDGAPSGTAAGVAWLDGTQTPSTNWCFAWRNGSSSKNVAVAGAGSGFSFGSWTWVATAPGYFELSVAVTRVSGTTQTHSTVGTPYFNLGDSSGECSGAGSDYGTSNMAGTAYGSWVADTAFDETPIPYRWGPEYVPNACAQYSVSVPDTSRTVVEAGESVGFLIEFDGGADPVELAVQWRTGETYQVVLAFDYLRASGANEVTRNVTVTPGSAVTLADVMVRCTRESEGSSYRPLTDEGWEGTEGVVRPCMRARVIWPENRIYDVDEEMRWVISLTGLPTSDDEIISVEYFMFDFPDESPPKYSEASWVSYGPMENRALPFEQVMLLEADYESTPQQVVLRCQDSSGYTYARQWSQGWGLKGAGTWPAEEDCYDSAGLGLNPKSWVPGLLKGMGCLGKSLIVPSSGDLDELRESAEAAAEKAPVSYLTEVGTELIDVFAGTPSGVLAHEDDCLVLMNDEPNMGDVNVCPSTMGGGSIGPWRSAIGVLFWFGAGWVLFAQTRRLLTS